MTVVITILAFIIGLFSGGYFMHSSYKYALGKIVKEISETIEGDG